jgi:DNA replication protein DnaC
MTTIQDILDTMARHNMVLPPMGTNIKTDNAEKVFTWIYTEMLKLQGRTYIKQPEYEKVVSWIADNEDKGLLLMGDCGRGKSYIARYVIPAIYSKKHGKIFKVADATEINDSIDTLKKTKFLVIDDLGNEYNYNVYGQKRNPIDEIVDSAERYGNILIITTNLTIKDLSERYGERVMSRLKKLTRVVAFQGEDLRG